MEPTHYYCDFKIGIQTKNKLQDEFSGFLCFLNHRIYKAEDIPQLKAIIDRKVKDFNAIHRRCKPLNVTLHKGINDEGYRVFTEFAELILKPAYFCDIKKL